MSDRTRRTPALKITYKAAILISDADEAIARHDRNAAEELIRQLYAELDATEAEPV